MLDGLTPLSYLTDGKPQIHLPLGVTGEICTMPSPQLIYLPPQFLINGKVLGNSIKQLRRQEFTGEASIRLRSYRHIDTHVISIPGKADILAVPKKVSVPSDFADVLLLPQDTFPSDVSGICAGARWLAPKALDFNSTSFSWEQHCNDIRASWKKQFFLKEEFREDGQIREFGLRHPQSGAIHAALAHWKVTYNPATIVMPTGTGKTETMLSLLACQRFPCLLVVVPNSALREQIANKFLTFGILKSAEFEVIGPHAQYPVVGMLEHRLRTVEEVGVYFGCCNVVVTTIQVVSGCSDEVQHKIAPMCSHLFIDEAHHIAAPSWEKFRRFFLEKTVLQFTATPFRSDGKHIDGQVIFNYPLRKAQEEDYFRPINFKPIIEFDSEQADEKIATAAVQQLESDLEKGFDHLVMARASTIARADRIHAIYARLGVKHQPLLVHNDMNDADKRKAIQQLRSRESRIVVCVDMFGEGFDLPQLKIAALHNIHKSLAITLQFTGRFTRTTRGIGDATMIANIADPKVEEALRDLYAEDADWNKILRLLSEGATKNQERRSEFLGGFTDVPTELPLQNVFPKMSAVVYRVKSKNWRPDRVGDVVKEKRLYAGPTVNHKEKVMLFVTCERDPIPWGDIKDLRNTTWDVYLIHWDASQNLLFINSSNNDSTHEDLAKAIGGDDVELIRGETIFRALQGVNRLILMNLGLKHSLSRAVRFSMYVGADIRQGLTESGTQNKIKSNLFGVGFENGDKATIGCSQKGRVWSYKIAYDMVEWVVWCRTMGAKLLDQTISTAEIFQSLIVPRQITDRPPLVPLTLEWSEDFLNRNEELVLVDIAGELVPFYEVGLQLSEHEKQGPIRFRVFTETNSIEYEVKFAEGSVEYVPVGEKQVFIEIARKRKSLSERFQTEPPVIRFEDGAFLIYNELFEIPRTDRQPYQADRIAVWDWTGTNLTKESQRQEKRKDSIQFRVIQELKNAAHDPSYDIIFDDDASNEAADVVALKVANDRLLIHLYHCKYSKSQAGARVKDLYEVCGQAQRSVYWKGDVSGLLEHLRNREASRLRKNGVSRFEKGNLSKLAELVRGQPFLTPELKIIIVQPGISKAQIESGQLDLLAATQLYLTETYGAEMAVIGSS